MNLAVKKIYCSKCQKLVRASEQTVSGSIRVSCPRCGNLLWTRDGLTWRYAGKNF